MNQLIIKDLKKVFRTIKGEVVALKDVNLKIAEGEFFVILGPSGCGKSTFLSIVAGLEKPTQGEIIFGDACWCSAEKRLFLEPKVRNTAMVFQSYALYPHMTVFQNIAFPLKLRGLRGGDIRRKVVEAAEKLRIGHLLGRRPAELSGGERQRTAIARAIVRNPSLFLMDEPLSNLDAQLRVLMRAELKNLQKELNVTTIYVTHDQLEATSLGDRILVLKDGGPVQVGTPGEIYSAPKNLFVATFVGSPSMNIFDAETGPASTPFFIAISGHRLRISDTMGRMLRERSYRTFSLGIRPEHIYEKSDDMPAQLPTVKAKVSLVENLGREFLIHFSIGRASGKMLSTKRPTSADIELVFPMANFHFFDKNGMRIGGENGVI